MINFNFVLNMRLMYNLENKGRGGGPKHLFLGNTPYWFIYFSNGTFSNQKGPLTDLIISCVRNLMTIVREIKCPLIAENFPFL